MRHRTGLWPLTLLLAMIPLLGYPEGVQFHEADVKAAFIYNLFKFVEWPADAGPAANGALSLCLLDVPHHLREALASLQGKTVDGHRIGLLDYRGRGCHAVVAGDMVSGATLEQLASEGTMTIGAEQFIERGGMVGLVTVNNHVRFEFNLTAARSGNIKLSSHLLKLAERIRGR